MLLKLEEIKCNNKKKRRRKVYVVEIYNLSLIFSAAAKYFKDKKWIIIFQVSRYRRFSNLENTYTAFSSKFILLTSLLQH